jgi:hypothetical protein
MSEWGGLPTSREEQWVKEFQRRAGAASGLAGPGLVASHHLGSETDLALNVRNGLSIQLYGRKGHGRECDCPQILTKEEF